MNPELEKQLLLHIFELRLSAVREFKAELDRVEKRLDTIQDGINLARVQFASKQVEVV